MRLTKAESAEQIVKTAIHDYEGGRVDEARSKLLSVVGAKEDLDPVVFEYLHLIAKYEGGCPSDSAMWNERFVESVTNLASNGNIEFQLKLAEMYRFGDRVLPDPSYSRRVYTQLANRGVAEAQYRLALLYKNGQCGLLESMDQYMRWLVESAENGFRDAEYELALLLLSVAPVSGEDRAKAIDLVRRAAAKGHLMARAALVEIESGSMG